MTYNQTRREFVRALGLGLCCLAGRRTLFGGLWLSSAHEERTLYVGTYTKGMSEGIYLCRFDPRTGSLSVTCAVKGGTNPSFLAIDRKRGRLFAVNETANFEGKEAGSVCAFAIDPVTEEPRFLNRRSSGGEDPCHLVVHGSGRFVLVANYSGGSVAVLEVREDGSLGEATDLVQHKGSSVKPRQQSPHAHSINLDASGHFAYVADLGLDRVMIYHFDDQKGKLIPAADMGGELKAGAGPRHLSFHPDGSTAYVVNELDSTLTAFAVDPSTGGLKERQTVSTLPEHFAGENYPADVHVAPSGRFLYASNRGHDSIAVFSIDGRTGELAILQHQPTQGKWPRNFTIDPTGRFLLVANQRSDTIMLFSIDPERGSLSPTDMRVEVPMPVCLKFL